MCRFAAYLGEPISINDIISRPQDSLIRQSDHALESEIEINGDGFGIGWYNHMITPIPAVLVSTLPAWNDINLQRIAHQIKAPCFFGHVRAAATGGVSIYNCHPFRYKHWLFMHNGGIGGFDAIKLDIFNLLSDIHFRQIQGHTDSETMFALWLTYYDKATHDLNGQIDAWKKTLDTIIELQQKHQVTEANYINALITNGNEMSGVRFATKAKNCLSLHYAAGETFKHETHGFRMLPSKKKHPQCIILSSERLSVHKEDWRDVPAQTAFTISKQCEITFFDLV